MIFSLAISDYYPYVSPFDPGTPQYGATGQPYGQPGYQQQAYENPQYGQPPPYGQPAGKCVMGVFIEIYCIFVINSNLVTKHYIPKGCGFSHYYLCNFLHIIPSVLDNYNLKSSTLTLVPADY